MMRGRMNLSAPFSSIAIGVLCGAGAALFWAAGFVAARHGIDVGFTPADITFHRCFWAGVVLLPLAWRAGLRDLNGIGWGRGIVLTFFGGLGIAFVSYNALPGGHLRAMLREMLLFHVRGFTSAQERIEQAASFSRFLAEHADNRSESGCCLRAEAQAIQEHDTGHLYHDELAELSALLGRSLDSGRNYVGQVIEVAYRLPKI